MTEDSLVVRFQGCPSHTKLNHMMNHMMYVYEADYMVPLAFVATKLMKLYCSIIK